ncbi:MAG TPA: HDOD domain-containing protein [Candidatus Binatia bacterium]|jgi:HD-like signal output (HDOD) protein|nr:HDOD domain-containing protein [Candidatus Binatia bacterium]
MSDAGPMRVEPAGADALRRRLARLKAVPTLPKQLEAVARALEDADVNFESIAELIEVDQALTSQTLRLANSAFYGTQGKVGRVSQALVVLGAIVTRSLVLSSAVFDVENVSLRGFWEHSLGCAVAAGALAKVTGLAQPEEATAAGLLHDLGKVVLLKELPDVFERLLARAAAEGLPFRRCERELLGVDHTDVAFWLVEHWGFPACLAEPIHHHHAPAHAAAAPNETAIVHVADALVRALGYGFGGDPLVPPIDAAAWARLRLSPAALDRVLDVFEADLDQALNFALFE